MSTRVTADAGRVLVVDDHRTFAELLVGALEREPDLEPAGHACTADEAVRVFAAERPDLVIMDVQLPDRDGFAATREIVAMSDDVRVVVLTAHGDPANATRAAEAGASAFLAKDGSLATMIETLRAARRGEFRCDPALLRPERGAAVRSDGAATGVARPGRRLPNGAPVPSLTPRESEVLQLLGEGRAVRDIAATLRLSEETCRGYVKNVLAKLGARTQLQAVVVAWRTGLLSRDGDV